MIKCCPSLQPDIAWEHFSQPAVEPKSCAKVLTFNGMEKTYAIFYSFLTLYLVLDARVSFNLPMYMPLLPFWSSGVGLPSALST